MNPATVAGALALVCAPLVVAAPFAWITNQIDDTVTVINTASGKAEATVKVGHRPAGVVASHDGRRIYVSNPESRDISIIDGETRSVI